MSWAAAGAKAWESVLGAGTTAFNATRAAGSGVVTAGAWGAGAGVVAGGAGWVASQFAPEYMQSSGPFRSAMVGGAAGIGGYVGYKAITAASAGVNMARPGSFLGRFTGWKTGGMIGLAAGAMAMRSIINTSFTRPANG